MRSLGDHLKRNESPEASPTSSSSDDDLNDALDFCPLCGGEPLCGGLGYVRQELPVDHPQFGKLVRCPYSPGTPDPARRERLRRLGNLDAFADKTFAAFKTDLPLPPTQRSSLMTALDIALRYAAQPDGWLLIEGTYGCGKTHLAAAIANARLEAGDAVLFITTPDLLDHLRTAYGPSAEISYDEMFDRLREAPMLVLDDLGVENPSAWAQEKLFQLLNHRYSRRLPTIITTNADLDTLDPRIRSRLLDENQIRRVRITAPDYRTPVQNQLDQVSNLTLYREMTFDSFDTRTNLNAADRQNLERALNEARTFAAAPQNWLVFMGTYFGCGKTHLAASIAHAQAERGRDVILLTVPDLLDYLRITYDPGASSRFDRRFQTVRDAPLLILDDLGTENATPWAKEKLFQILNHRYVAALPTVITTAKTEEELDPRIVIRLMDTRRCKVIQITAPSYVRRMRR